VSALLIEGLVAGYGSVPVLRDVALRVEEGEVVALLGANGAGKTTTLRAICATTRRTGAIDLFGTDISRSTTEAIAHAGVAHVPQGRGILGPLTVEENLRLGVFRRGSRAERTAAVEQIYETFPRLAAKRRQLAGSLSGGEQQMVALGRAFASRPRILLIDEPSLGLAPKVASEVFAAIEDLRARHGTACLVVEQNARAVLRFADRGYVMANGQIALQGSAEHLATEPAVQHAYLGV
jgi:branched-chain amino acid transport system ATP-binding protein